VEDEGSEYISTAALQILHASDGSSPLEISNPFLEQSGDFTVMKMSAPEAIRLLKAGNIRCHHLRLPDARDGWQ